MKVLLIHTGSSGAINGDDKKKIHLKEDRLSLTNRIVQVLDEDAALGLWNKLEHKGCTRTCV
jgi:hypothetical protein